MVFRWEPDTQYDIGTYVSFAGIHYKVIQSHRSQSDWMPPNVPALYVRVPVEEGGEEHHSYREEHHPPHQPNHPPHDADAQTIMQHHEQQCEGKTHTSFLNLPDDKKTELEIGGGLLAGVAAIGAGYYAYQHHRKSEEEKKAHAYALTNWLREAQARRDQFNSRGPQGPTTWILCEGHAIPREAIQGGQEEDGKPIYICRAYFEGGVHIGKAAPHFVKGGLIGWGNKEIETSTYEILIGDPRAIRWTPASGQFAQGMLPQYRPIEGGHENDGRPLLVIQSHVGSGVHPGKCQIGGHALIPYGGHEKECHEYNVLCYC